MKIIVAILALSLSGCAVFTAQASLPAYLAAHAGGVTAVATVGGIAATTTSLLVNTHTLVKDAEAK